MKPFVPPKRFVPAPVYVPIYLPYGGAFGTNPFLPGGLGLTSTGCQTAPLTLGDLGTGGAYTGFAPVTLGAPQFDSLESPSLSEDLRHDEGFLGLTKRP